MHVPNGISPDILKDDHFCTIRRLGELCHIFTRDIPEERLQHEVYRVYQERENGEKGLLFGYCLMKPGRVVDEYFMTVGHTHQMPNGEVYFGISGIGVLLMHDERNPSLCRAEEIAPGKIIYVPAHWAHRHVNVGSVDLVTAFAVNAEAGHNYDHIKEHPFQHTVVHDPRSIYRIVQNDVNAQEGAL